MAKSQAIDDHRSMAKFLRQFSAVAAVLAVTAQAEDWPQWRGPSRDGAWNETGILHAFPAEGLKIRWRQPMSFGHSSPVVAAGRVFVSDADLAKPPGRERIHCFDETTGKRLWSYGYDVKYPDWAFTPGQAGGPCATPIVEGGRIYMIGANGHVHCLDAHKGTVIWERNLAKKYGVESWMCRASPLIEGNLLILSIGGKPQACLLAVDKKTGKEMWRALDEKVSNSSPVVINAAGKRQLIVWTCVSVTSLDPATGRTYWREPMVTSNDGAVSSPVVQKNRLLIGGMMFELNSSQPAAAMVWPEKKAVSKRILSNTSTALLQGDHVFSAKSSGEFVCLEAATGTQVWQTNSVTDLKGGASVHMTTNGDGVFLFTDKGDLIRAKLAAQGFQEVSRARLVEPATPFGDRKCAWAAPAYANGHVFARSEQELVCASLAAER
jgi:outer membrane protein assembly factor BamB